jgi:hypothetical protein
MNPSIKRCEQSPNVKPDDICTNKYALGESQNVVKLLVHSTVSGSFNPRNTEITCHPKSFKNFLMLSVISLDSLLARYIPLKFNN